MAAGNSFEYRAVDDGTAQRANRADWDAEADDYQAEHGAFLGDADLVWCPEGVREADIGLLGDVAGSRIAEIGCGAGQASRWLTGRGATAVGVDLSFRQLQHSRRLDDATDRHVPVACAAGTSIPFADGSFDAACSVFGALSFVVELPVALGEIARILRPGGRLALSVVHPARRMFADDPTLAGMTIQRSYFDRASYVELGGSGQPTYVEPHHTLADWIGSIIGAGFGIDRLVEPEWPADLDRAWGGWGPERGEYLPGSLLIAASLPRL